MTAPPATPALDKRSKVAASYDAVVEFLEWLTGRGMVIHQWSTGLTDQRPCAECQWRLALDKDPDPECPRCSGTGLVEVALDDCYLPITGSPEALVEQFLDLDPVAMEQERRALLDHIRGR